MKKIQKIIIIYILLFSSIGMANHSENLQKLKDLYDDNILTEDQYNEAKEKVLQQMEINNLDVANNDSPDTSDINKISPPEADAELQDYQFNKETWLSNYELKPKDLSPMLLELSKETQETVPECTTDFCFTMQTEYATDEILNKGALINALYRHHPDIIATLNNDPNKKRGHDYCQEVSSINGMAYGCYQVKEKFIYDENGETIRMVDKLFPEEASPDCKPLIGEKDIPCKNRVTAYVYSDGGAPMTPDDWLEANGLSDEDLVSMLKDYPSTYRFEGN